MHLVCPPDKPRNGPLQGALIIGPHKKERDLLSHRARNLLQLTCLQAILLVAKLTLRQNRDRVMIYKISTKYLIRQNMVSPTEH